MCLYVPLSSSKFTAYQLQTRRRSLLLYCTCVGAPLSLSHSFYGAETAGKQASAHTVLVIVPKTAGTLAAAELLYAL